MASLALPAPAGTVIPEIFAGSGGTGSLSMPKGPPMLVSSLTAGASRGLMNVRDDRRAASLRSSNRVGG